MGQAQQVWWQVFNETVQDTKVLSKRGPSLICSVRQRNKHCGLWKLSGTQPDWWWVSLGTPSPPPPHPPSLQLMLFPCIKATSCVSLKFLWPSYHHSFRWYLHKSNWRQLRYNPDLMHVCGCVFVQVWHHAGRLQPCDPGPAGDSVHLGSYCCWSGPGVCLLQPTGN